MSTTNTSFSTLISAIDTKAQSLASSTTDAKDLVYLGKAIEALNIPDTVSAVIDEGDTQVTRVTNEGTTQVAAVQAAASGYATITYVDTEIAGLVDSAPGTLDTLNELAAALGDDANFSTTVTNSIATKMPISGGVFTGGVVVTGTLSADDTFSIESSSGFANIEMGGPSGAYIDMKSPMSDDFDGRMQYDGNNLKLVTNSDTSIILQHNATTRVATTSTGASVTGDLSVSGNVSGNYTNLHPEVTTTSAAASSQTFDMNDPMTHMTMTAATTFTATNLAAGKTSMMVLDTTASAYTPSWVSDIKWPDATEPTWADYRYWIVSFTCLNGTTTLASASGYTV